MTGLIMAEILLDVDEANGRLPEVCMCCGRPATTTVRRRMQWHPGWVTLTILLHPFIYIIVALCMTRRVVVQAPLCDAHRWHWFKRSVWMWGTFVLLGLAGVGTLALASSHEQHPNDRAESYACVASSVLFLVWIAVVIVCKRTGIRPTEIDDENVELTGVSEEFVEAVDEEREELEERRAARRGEKKPSGIAKVLPAIFISYRRSDSQDVTGRIYDRLVAKYTKKQVFKDVDNNNIPLGISFAAHIKQKIGKANVVLVIIGPSWLTAADKQGRRRLDDPGDFVRVEIETALRANIPVVPVLVANTRMPLARELPKSIQKLLSRNGSEVRPDPDFNNDIKRLFVGIEHLRGLRIKPKPGNANEKDRGEAIKTEPASAAGSKPRQTLRTLLILFVVLLLLSPIAFYACVLLGFVDTQSMLPAWLEIKKPGARPKFKDENVKRTSAPVPGGGDRGGARREPAPAAVLAREPAAAMVAGRRRRGAAPAAVSARRRARPRRSRRRAASAGRAARGQGRQPRGAGEVQQRMQGMCRAWLGVQGYNGGERHVPGGENEKQPPARD
jgi:TIR domain